MLFYKSLAVISTLAFGSLSVFAAPAAAAAGTVAARCDCETVPAILADVRVNITVDVESLRYLTKDNCTTEVVGPIVTNIKGVIADATAKVKALSNQPADVVLGVGVDVTAVAGLIADLLNLVFGAIGVVVNLGADASVDAVLPLLSALGEVLGALVCAILSVTGGILSGLEGAIVSLIGGVVGVILQISVSVLVSVLGL